jgi:DNA-binding transcriptional ArsR family regulator
VSALRLDSGASPLRRRLGPVPWFVLEELVLLAGVDSAVETSVRALAASLSLNKDTVARALGRLRDEGLVVSEPQPNLAGCFGPARYQPGPVAGLQRLDDEETRPRSPRPPTLAAAPELATDIQLSLIDDRPTYGGRHPTTESPTTPQYDDALAPGVRGHPAPVPRDAQDRPPLLLGNGRPEIRTAPSPTAKSMPHCKEQYGQWVAVAGGVAIGRSVVSNALALPMTASFPRPMSRSCRGHEPNSTVY